MGQAHFELDRTTAFRSTMPERYRSAFDSSEARQHAAIVGRRAGAIVRVEIWQRRPGGVAALCVVADDRPGLLSLVSAALVACETDVISAQIYTRTVPETGRSEAVDLLWVRRASGGELPLLPADAARIGSTLHSLLAGRSSVESVLRRARPPARRSAGASTRVTFDENPDLELAVLTVETSDRPGLLLAISQALFRAHVQIIASEATTVEGRAADRFTIVELDGQPIRTERRGRVQMEVLGAIEALARGLPALTRA